MPKDNDYRAHLALSDTARLRVMLNPSAEDALEDTQPMTIISRRMRRDEALKLWLMSPKVQP